MIAPPAVRRVDGVRCTGAVLLAGATLMASIVSASADNASERTSVVGVRAEQACMKEEVRISGFAVARDERGVNLDAPGYRVTEILVSEGDKVAADQDLLRAVRIGDDAQGPSGTPPAGGSAAAQRAGLPSSLSLRSPIAGIITRIGTKVGAVSGGAPMPRAPGLPPEPAIRIAATSGIDLLVDVPSLFATQIRKGTTARILRDNAGDVTGTVRVPVSEINPASQLGQARIAVEPSSALRAGQFASAVIETARGCGVAVPQAAVSYQNGVASVQVIKGSRVETRSVRTGLTDGANVQIREGLAEGEPVVATVGSALKTGDQVTPILPGETAGTVR